MDFVPWTRLDEKIKSLSAEIAKLNENKIVKAETEIVCADGQSFVYDSLPHTPVLGEYIPNTVCRFAQGQSDEWTDTAPSAKGSYRMKVTVEESLYRKAAEKIISFTIVSANLITEDYVSEKKTVRFNVEGYTVSLNGIDYVPYGRNSEIDVTSMIGNGGRPKYVWLKEGNKAPFGYRVKQYDRIMIQDFEKGTVPAYSNYKPSGIVRKEGNYSGQLDLKYNASEGKYTSELRFIDMNYPMNGQNLYSIAGRTQVEFWMYTDKADCGQLERRCNTPNDYGREEHLDARYLRFRPFSRYVGNRGVCHESHASIYARHRRRAEKRIYRLALRSRIKIRRFQSCISAYFIRRKTFIPTYSTNCCKAIT